jgi:hypothetical protein
MWKKVRLRNDDLFTIDHLLIGYFDLSVVHCLLEEGGFVRY